MQIAKAQKSEIVSAIACFFPRIDQLAARGTHIALDVAHCHAHTAQFDLPGKIIGFDTSASIIT
jgi:hypothetical protein